jgi:predicted ester cyclase
MNVESLFQAWTEPDTGRSLEARFAELYADPVLVNGAPVSVDDLVQRARSLHAAFSSLRADILQVVEAADSLAVAFNLRGRHTGPYPAPGRMIAATGAEVEIRTIDVLTLTDGKISRIWVNADDLGLLRQLETP